MKQKTLVLALFAITLFSCTGKSSKTENANVETNATEEKLSANKTDKDGIITEDLLWEILMKTPTDKILEDMGLPKDSLRKAKADSLFRPGYEENQKNYLRYDETNVDGIRKFVNIACYPSADGKKLICIFNCGGGIDIYITTADLTYEYELATGTLTSIERPIDPYTLDEFYNPAFFTSKQFNAIQKSFGDKQQYFFGEYDEDGFSALVSVDSNLFEDWEEFQECSFVTHRYSSDYGWVKRYWNGMRFVKRPEAQLKSTINTITNHSVDGIFIAEKIDNFIIKVKQRYSVKQESLNLEGNDYVVYNVYEEDEKLYSVEPNSYDPSIIYRIRVYDSRFKTKEGIGANSTFADLKSKYEIRRVDTENGLRIYVEELYIDFVPDESQVQGSWYEKSDYKKLPDNLRIKKIIID